MIDKSPSLVRIFAPRFWNQNQQALAFTWPLLPAAPMQGLNEPKSEQKFAFQPYMTSSLLSSLCSRSFDTDSIRTYHWMRCSPPYLYCQNAFHIYVLCPCSSDLPCASSSCSLIRICSGSCSGETSAAAGGQGSRKRSIRSPQYRYRYYQRVHCHYRVPIQPWPRWYVLAY